jgi:hypothetical protein
MTTSLPRLAYLLSLIIPRNDRESIVGDLVEDADVQQLCGLRRDAWLARECGAVALGLSLQRTRSWFILPPMRELVAGIGIDGRAALRGHPAAALLRTALFCGSVTVLMFGVELLIGSLLTAGGL